MTVKILAGHCVQIGHISNDFVMIWMNAKRGLLDGLSQKKHWFVLATLTLRNDDGSLRRHFVCIKLAVDHAIRLEPQGDIYFIGGHGFKIRGPIHVSECVPRAAFARDRFIKDIGWELWRTLELHMLHPVRNSGATLHFIARANTIP